MQIMNKLRGKVREYDMRWHNFLLGIGRETAAPGPSGLEVYDEIVKHAQALGHQRSPSRFIRRIASGSASL